MSTNYTAKGEQFGNIDLGYKVCKVLLTQYTKGDPIAVVYK